ncbi:hypothetical protein GCM10022419_065440 [Nonomuraea rosea]|uniref:Uncharacterized protein n=1 Tax=Nonomuraea rosea TaxID=638574 RepID=A0ABP6Y035_9ACTN
MTAIGVEGYTSVRPARIEVRDVNVLGGANGAGKSNLVLRLISHIDLLGYAHTPNPAMNVGLPSPSSTRCWRTCRPRM